MNGIICIDKPEGFTSFDVVAKLRGIAKTRKVGHGGTLDPMATGVLPLFLGTATKACDLLPVQDKRYQATFRLGTETDTLDITGEVTARHEVAVSAADVEAALGAFRGRIEQVPPMYSAVQVGGKRLYDLARKGVEVERPARQVEIHRLELLNIDESAFEYSIDVYCSKGTYIRSLVGDLGEALGCGAVLTALRRTESCGFTLKSCITLDQAQQEKDNGTLEQKVLPVSQAFGTLPKLVLGEEQARLLQNGVRLQTAEVPLPRTDETRLTVWAGESFLGLVDIEEGQVRVKRLFQREVAV